MYFKLKQRAFILNPLNNTANIVIEKKASSIVLFITFLDWELGVDGDESSGD